MVKVLWVTDLDGTFLDDSATYDVGRMAALLKQMKAKEIAFVAASGRGLNNIQSLFKDFLDDIYIIAENGSIAQNQQEIFYQETMTPAVYQAIVAQLQACPDFDDNYIILSGKQAAYLLDSALESVGQDLLSHYYSRVETVASFDQVTDAIFKVDIFATPDKIAACQTWLESRIQSAKVMTTGFETIDIVLPHVDKGRALSQLAQALEVSATDVVVFGDNLNDLGMFDFAGTALATANAKTQVKVAADRTIGSHNAGAVLEEMERMIREL